MSALSAPMEVRTIVCPILRTNSFVVRRRGSHRCIVIDPGIPATTVPEALRRWGFTPEAVLLTHGHGDHICGIIEIKRHWPECPVLVSHGDAPMLTDFDLNLSAYCGFPFTVGKADLLIENGQFRRYAGLDFEVRHTPGHTPGHVSYLFGLSPDLSVGPWDDYIDEPCMPEWHPETSGVLFVGDLMMAGRLGRSAIHGCDEDMMVHSIHESVFSLPDATRICPGHGIATDVLTERISNTLRMSRSKRATRTTIR